MLRIPLATVLCAALSAQNPLYVDPVSGIDQVGGGSATNPLKTVTYAVSQVPAAGPATIYLRPGSYTSASGEVFPIVVPGVCTIESDPAVVPPGARSAVFEAPYATIPVFDLPAIAQRNVALRNLNMQGATLIGVRMNVYAGSLLATLLIEDCTIAEQRPLEVNVNTAATTIVSVLRSRLNGVDSPIAVHTTRSTGVSVELLIERTTLINGISGGLVLDARTPGTINAKVRASHIRSAVRYGVIAVSQNMGQVNTRFEHCLFHDNGNNVIGGGISNGAIYDQVDATGVPPAHTIVNSIFAKNMTDASNGASPTYTWGKNIVKQASLGAFGGNIVGAPTFVNAAGNDFHLAPTSLGVDRGNAADVTMATDIDGEPRLSPFGGAGPDIGSDETFLGATFTNDGARLGEALTLRTSWSPSTPFAFVLASAAVPNSFGPGQVHLAGVIVDPGLNGTCGATGVGEASLVVPNDASLHGVSVYWQSIANQVPYLGANARRTLILKP